MKKILLLSFFILLINEIKAQNWSAVPGYQISYGDISGITRYQNNIWVGTTSGIYKITGSTWNITSTNLFSVNSFGCLYTDGVELYAGGLFNFGTFQALVIKWDGSQWIPIGYTDNTASGVWVKTILKTSSGRIYTGGFFNFIGNSPVTLNNFGYMAVFDGASWIQPYVINATGCAASIESIQQIGDSIYVAGGFYESNSTWSPATFRFKEQGGMTPLDGYGFCGLARDYTMYQSNLYVGGTRQHDNINVNVGLVKRLNNSWSSLNSQMQLINTKTGKLSGKLFIAGTPGGGLNGVPINIVSYDGSSFLNEGVGVSYPNNMNVYPSISTMFIDTIESKLYVAGNFRKVDGNVADNFAVRTIYPLPVNLSKFAGSYRNGKVHLDWRDETPEDGVEFQVQASVAGGSFKTIGRVIEKQDQYDYSFDWTPADCGKYLFQLAFEGKTSAKIPITIPCGATSIHQAGKQVIVKTESVAEFRITNLFGQLISKEIISKGQTVRYYDKLAPGMYVVQVITRDGRSTTQQLLF